MSIAIVVSCPVVRISLYFELYLNGFVKQGCVSHFHLLFVETKAMYLVCLKNLPGVLIYEKTNLEG